MILSREIPRLAVVVRAVAKPGFHPRPVTPRYVERPGENVTWWRFHAVGWHAIRRSVAYLGIGPASSINPRGSVAAWRFDDGAVYDGAAAWMDWFQLDDCEAAEAVREIGIPRASEIAHSGYEPVSAPLPRGREGAARRLARRLPTEVTPEVASAVYRMFSSMEDCAARRYHLHFWSWALRNRGVMTQPVVSVGTQRREGSEIPPQDQQNPHI